MSGNIFTTLSKHARSNFENFCTDGLAWILTNDEDARSAFFVLVQESLSMPLKSAVETLSRREEVQFETRRSFRLADWRGRPTLIYPDIWIEDPESNLCLMVEVKVGARTTYRRGRHDDTGESEETRNKVSQAEAYRGWLTENRPNTGILCALITEDLRDLTLFCDGSMTWNELAGGLRASTNSVTKWFCAFLEDQGMANKDVQLTESDILLVSKPNWEALGSLLDEIVDDLTTAIWDDGIQAKADHDFIQISPEAGVWVWTGTVRMKRDSARLSLTPYLKVAGDSVDVVVGLIADRLDSEFAIRHAPSQLVQEVDGEVFVSIRRDPPVIENQMTRMQARDLTDSILQQLGPVVRSSLSSSQPD